MTLQQEILKKLNIQLAISGGAGTALSKAIVIEKGDLFDDPVSTEYEVLDCISKLEKWMYYKVIRQQLVFSEGRPHDMIEIECMLQASTGLTQTKKSFYFDISKVKSFGGSNNPTKPQEPTYEQMKMFLDKLQAMLEKHLDTNTANEETQAPKEILPEPKSQSPEEKACASFTNAQKNSLLKLMQGTYTTHTGLKLPLSTLGVQTTLCAPAIVVRIPTTNSVQWDSATDYITLPALEYKIIETDGTTRNITISELSKFPDAQFQQKSPGHNDLQGCILLTSNQVKKS